jgi:hypothetical protein
MFGHNVEGDIGCYAVRGEFEHSSESAVAMRCGGLLHSINFRVSTAASLLQSPGRWFNSITDIVQTGLYLPHASSKVRDLLRSFRNIVDIPRN